MAWLMQLAQEAFDYQAVVPASLACVFCRGGILQWSLSEVVTLPVYGVLGNSNGGPITIDSQVRCYAAAALMQPAIAVYHDDLQAAGAYASTQASKGSLSGEARAMLLPTIHSSMKCMMVWVPPVAAHWLLRPAAAAVCTQAVPGMPGSLGCRARWCLYASVGAGRMSPAVKQHPAQQVWPQLGPLLP